jgi:hypothetical protein
MVTLFKVFMISMKTVKSKLFANYETAMLCKLSISNVKPIRKIKQNSNWLLAEYKRPT